MALSIAVAAGKPSASITCLLPLKVVKDNLLPRFPLFQMIQEAAGTDWREMSRYLIWGNALKYLLIKKLRQPS